MDMHRDVSNILKGYCTYLVFWKYFPPFPSKCHLLFKLFKWCATQNCHNQKWAHLKVLISFLQMLFCWRHWSAPVDLQQSSLDKDQNLKFDLVFFFNLKVSTTKVALLRLKHYRTNMRHRTMRTVWTGRTVCILNTWQTTYCSLKTKVFIQFSIHVQLLVKHFLGYLGFQVCSGVWNGWDEDQQL